MESVLRIALSNAALATIAAILAWAAGKLARKPALTHALWVIVLLKLVTPPVWTLPVHVPVDRSKMVEQPISTMPIAPEMQSNDRQVTLASANVEGDPASDLRQDVSDSEIVAGEERVAVGPAATPSSPPPLSVSPFVAWPWKSALAWIGALVWGIGALFCIALCVRRIVAFRRVLRYAVAAEPQYQKRVEFLSRRLGMGAGPHVQLVPGAVCPMLWSAAAKPRILVPSGLWQKLDARQRDTLLLHELAHLRRRDHWVRWIELLATALYWWHPVCWWAKHELREAEEQCCDAWVLWAMPDSFEDYASALLEAVDFVSIRPSVPLLASGMGQFGHLKRRLTMLKQGNVARALSWSGFAAACGVGAILLSIAPTFADDTNKTPTAEKPEAQTASSSASAQSTAPVAVQTRVEAVTTETTPVTVSVVQAAPAAPEAPAAPGSISFTPAPPAAGSSDSAPASPAPEALPKPRNADSNFRFELKEAQGDGDEQQQGQKGQQQQGQQQQGQQQRQQDAAMRKNQAELEKARRDVQDLSRRLQQAAERLKQLEMSNAQGEFAKAQKMQQDMIAKAKAGFQFQNLKPEVRIETRDGRIARVGPLPKGGDEVEPPILPPANGYINVRRPPGRSANSEEDRDRRLDNVERQLSQLLNEVKRLRTDREKTPPTPSEPQAR